MKKLNHLQLFEEIHSDLPGIDTEAIKKMSKDDFLSYIGTIEDREENLNKIVSIMEIWLSTSDNKEC